MTDTLAYLEDSDFDQSGGLINPDIPKEIPTVVFIQASWCPHCRNAKPAFQEFANRMKGKVFAATIQSDGERESEKALGKRVKQIKPGFRGFPDYVLFVNGKRVNREISGRGLNDLMEFSKV